MLDKYANLNFLQRVLRLKSLFAEKGGIVATGDGKGIVRSGEDADKSFQFIQLSDFIKDAYAYSEELGILPMVSEVIGDKAVMTIYDATKEIADQPNPLKIEISSSRTSGLGEMQGIGSQITFSRRYLWMTFLDLCARDELDEGVYNEEIEKAIIEQEKAEETKTEVKETPQKPTDNTKPVKVEPVKAAKVEKPAPKMKAEEKIEPVAEPVMPATETTAKAEERPYAELTDEDLNEQVQMMLNYKDEIKTYEKDDLVDCLLEFYGVDLRTTAGKKEKKALENCDIPTLKKKIMDILIDTLNALNREIELRQ